MNLSISKIQEYEKCPYSFWFSYIKKEPKTITPIQLKEGVEKHEMFDKSVVNVKTKILPNLHQYAGEKSLPEFLLSSLQTELQQLPNYEKYKQDCQNFITFCKTLQESGNDVLPAHTELKLTDSDLMITGVIDRVDIENEKCLIMDYKTGKDHPIDEFYFQLAVYVYLFEKQYNKKVTHWGILFTHSGKWSIEEINRNEIELAQERIKLSHMLIQQAEKRNYYPKQPSKLCPWCQWFQERKCEGE